MRSFGADEIAEWLIDWDPASNVSDDSYDESLLTAQPGNWMWLSCSAFFSQYCEYRSLAPSGELLSPMSRSSIRSGIMAKQNRHAWRTRPKVLSRAEGLS